MPTDNPKVSAYVPQALKDRLTQFRQERELSESQAVIAILAEYFQMKEEIGRGSDRVSVGGVTLARMEDLEKRMSDLQSLVNQRFQELSESINNGRLSSGSQVDQKESLPDKPLVDKQGSEVDGDVQADSSKEIANEAAKETTDEAAKESVASEENGSSDGRSPVESQDVTSQGRPILELQSKPLSDFEPVTSVRLSQRFGKGNQSVKHRKRKNKDNMVEFIQWTQGEDPDGIAWEPVDKGYVPTGELTSEQKSSLLRWYREKD